ncbi:MAG: Flp pilus assembly complex ATPase component TadA [Planctomycetes bacterium]|nr:Flp pilus assembly complex ATPase component TadA [Planctomycetota bacterium]
MTPRLLARSQGTLALPSKATGGNYMAVMHASTVVRNDRRADESSPSETVLASDPVAATLHLVEIATQMGASDLHLDPIPGGHRIRLRIPGGGHARGTLLDVGTLKGPSDRVVGRLKSIAQLLVYRQDLPQEGCIPRGALEGLHVPEIRVSTYPAQDGERVALRFGTAEPLALCDLGFGDAVMAEITRVLDDARGVVLVTGPSGSGKTTTLYACLDRLANAGVSRSILTIEDPIERRIEGLVQTSLCEAIGLDGSAALRSLMRQDPEVLMVGEVRDASTAALVLEAGLTGHLVLSTLHAGGPEQVLARLFCFGLEPFAIGHALRGILSQRLVHHEGGSCIEGTWLGLDDALQEAIRARAPSHEVRELVDRNAIRFGGERP